ncbi:hypothetical protein B0H15DRAFT_787917 [Mycena belliarum]|uniref:BTB domain-containing protein n=1 Tax=Mycena belliarum TaxID=1033014 RepID=A0AAD6TVZ6_9AGAR|nr:hypothetical protein B0H15DRAFT_787917 [Mycena belliae]
MSGLDAPPAKRQRVEDAPVTRSKLWHDDGSVVLQAEGTQFRIHWSVLSLHSSFFRDMRSLPQPPDQPSLEGCPIIELPDSSTDVKHLLEVLYDPSVPHRPFRSLPLPFIASMVRMGRKYEFKNLLAAAVECLTYENPTTLDAYDKSNLKIGNIVAYTTTQIKMKKSLVFDTAVLARENDLLTILPCAYFRLIDFYTQEILDGLSATIRLPFPDQRSCILGREKLLKAQWEQHWILSDTRADGCRSKLNCIEGRKFCRDWGLKQGVTILSLKPDIADTTLCDLCWTSYSEEMHKGRKELWDKLPSFFDLPPWNELKNEL